MQKKKPPARKEALPTKKQAQQAKMQTMGPPPPRLFMPELNYGPRGEKGYVGINYKAAGKMLRKLNPQLEVELTPQRHAFKTRNGGWFLRILYDSQTGDVKDMIRR